MSFCNFSGVSWGFSEVSWAFPGQDNARTFYSSDFPRGHGLWSRMLCYPYLYGIYLYSTSIKPLSLIIIDDYWRRGKGQPLWKRVESQSDPKHHQCRTVFETNSSPRHHLSACWPRKMIIYLRPIGANDGDILTW